ncbi:MAG: 3-phosphoserine/phosphohydroxythreonine transaminase [Methylophilaceae bacterium]|jgi:phosphoserine aminotransferase|uniref:3-phosphoserine/phosphohydroxythreonine transaminase n=1 Tax=Methylobacillus sp. MM3 TaxID=1848039 RepID=UPI0007DF2D1B|nr:3-phosphoserine/phosphohydroxythreonine transaminase [Methylobacillus sp. MM3]OAJ71944.1 phosphoserine transaminase [Methylobacillus sp. MM3]
MSGVYNFAAGPGMMPAQVLEQAQREFLDWKGHGFSLLEMPFTGDDFKAIQQRAQDRLRKLLDVPDNYRILFMHGGASAQFSLVPLNLLGDNRRADYLETGHWSRRAITEGRRYCLVNVAGSSRGSDFNRMPMQHELQVYSKTAYCHYTSNETANGVQFHYVPETGKVPLVVDMTSDFLSRPLDVSRYGVIYASSQKNIGPAGFTVVIVREDLLGRARPATPMVFDYRMQNDANSLLNTPVTFSIYLAELVFGWVEEQGGIAAMEQNSLRRSRLVYRAIEKSEGFYRCPVESEHRSRVNVCFTLSDESLTPRFLEEAAKRGLINLKGHSMIGGIRASLYNAMPDEGVVALAAFMDVFAMEHAAYV